MQVLLMNAPKDTEVGAERRPCSLAGIAVDFAVAIAVLIPCPLVHAMADGGMRRMAATIALPFIGVQDRAVPWHILGNQAVAGTFVRVIADPEALLPRLSCDEAENGRTVVRIGAMSCALIGASTGWIGGIAMGCAFFPRVLVQFVGLKGGAGHHPGRRSRVQISLDALPEGMELFT